ncbi:FliA/WhiG family RNA polymerase sigma factor [Pseudomonas oligotrophica]|uniref:FliA/WhiG family RNA polymerase sigma factor n=1 Tax=Pseudomonas oligotrophica TaxID=2912055 RepID=UPI001F018A8D|nr:FliA/WhiG family RNA polymerase sigma factor [Pseudomonas oligotrophica]MCF7200614.1 FliA/WhiG family RNA polymerase sigma factor [Pseudomonas oligotrophica]
MSLSCAIDYYGNAPSAPALFAPGAEQRWMLQYLPLVKRIVRQLALQTNQVLDREDMEQIGMIGLLECLRRYGEPDEGFGRFAALRIRGAILDELRRQDWRPRQVRQQVHKVRDAIRALMRQLGRQPSDEEIRAATGLDEQDYQDYLWADSSEALESLDELLHDGHEQFAEQGELLEDRLVRERLLQQALARLDERERLVLTLYYQHELSLKEIALVLEVSDARVCQLSKQAIGKCCRFLTERSQ